MDTNYDDSRPAPTLSDDERGERYAREQMMDGREPSEPIHHNSYAELAGGY